MGIWRRVAGRREPSGATRPRVGAVTGRLVSSLTRRPAAAGSSNAATRPATVGRPLLALAIAAAAAACATGPAATPPIRAGTPAAPREVNVILRDYTFVPTPIDLVPGETVRFFVINGGMVAHEFVLGPQDVQDAWARADAAATPPIFGATPPPASVPPGTGGVRILLDSGRSATFLYRVPTDAPPLLECHVPGHLERGMVGAIRFVSSNAGAGPSASPR